MAQITPTERLEVALTTPCGDMTVPVDVPTGFVPITAILSSLRAVGEQAMAMEEQQAGIAGERVSCQKGCAACCRMLVPVSAPEAFALHDVIAEMPQERRSAVRRKLDEARRRLLHAGLLDPLTTVAESSRQLTDEEMEPVNHAYYGLQMPCPFLEEEVCSIYEDRPAACRELLVTSPAELCSDLVHNPVRPLPVPLRISTVLGLLWSELAGGPIRFIPLPLAWDWAQRHLSDRSPMWRGAQLFERAIEMIWRFLVQEFHHRGVPLPDRKHN